MMGIDDVVAFVELALPRSELDVADFRGLLYC
jgi:hypothetical protein